MVQEDVWDYVREHDLPYNPLYDKGYTSIGCAPCTRPTQAGEDLRAGRWGGRRTRKEAPSTVRSRRAASSTSCAR